MNVLVLDGMLSVCRLPPSEAVPAWAQDAPFLSITRTAKELSLVVPSARVPLDVRAEGGWRALELEGPIPFTATGVLESLLAPLARACVPVFALSTFDTDYVLVGDANLARAVDALRSSGHRVGTGSTQTP
jgi:hypothetical protein